MPTNEERREVAARLREWVGTPRLAGYGVHRVICYAIYKDAWIGVNGNELVAAVADLIDPEPERTCRNCIDGYRDMGGNPLNGFACSECGALVEPKWTSGHPRWKWCPNCGSKVILDA